MIGLDRNLHGKPTGVRTLALVGLGAAMMTMAASDFALDAPNLDAMSRVVQGIITGVGFIGGGVILRNSDERSVFGLTTAAAVWVTAALGIVCGLGNWRIAAIGAGLVLVILLTGQWIERVGQRLLGTSNGPEAPKAGETPKAGADEG